MGRQRSGHDRFEPPQRGALRNTFSASEWNSRPGSFFVDNARPSTLNHCP